MGESLPATIGHYFSVNYTSSVGSCCSANGSQAITDDTNSNDSVAGCAPVLPGSLLTIPVRDPFKRLPALNESLKDPSKITPSI